MIIRAICILLLPVCAACGEDPTDESGKLMDPVETQSVNEFVRDPVEYRDVDSTTAAKLEFKTAVIDFDSIQEGEIIEREYAFENTGESALVIADVFSSCGCTVPSWPKGPIEPGEEGSIKVRFNSEDRPGAQDKPVTVISNAIPRRYELRLKGFVKHKNKTN